MAARKKKRGEAKGLHEIFEETDKELIVNIEKTLHLDGGGKVNHYENLAKEIERCKKDMHTTVGRFIWDRDDTRLTNLRISVLKRTVLQKLRLESKGANIELKDYLKAYKKAVEATRKHPKRMKPSD